MSPYTNRRSDEYGGDLKSRMRFRLRILAAVRQEWPSSRPVSVRISATDGIVEEMLAIAIARGEVLLD